MNANLLCWIICLGILLFHPCYSQKVDRESIRVDTITEYRKTNISGFLATSVFINSNWKEINNSSILISGSLDVVYIKSEKQKKRIIEIHGELSYMKYFDSTWIKNTDNYILSTIWGFKERKGISKSLLFNLKSQFTNSWEIKSSNSIPARKWISGPLIPLILATGYGINFSFSSTSYLNISLASIKINSRSRLNSDQYKSKVIARTDKIILESQWGSNVQSTLKFNFSKTIFWDGFYSIFFSSIDKRSITFDVRNSLSIKLPPHFTIKFENKFAYDKIISNSLQMRNELLFGYLYSK